MLLTLFLEAFQTCGGFDLVCIIDSMIQAVVSLLTAQLGG